MKAVRIHEHGGPEVLRYEEAPEPALRADEVLVRVRACSLNHLDLWIRKGVPGIQLTMPHILGSDAAGEVVGTGAYCEQVKPGDRVLIAPGQSSRRYPASAAGKDNWSPDYRLRGYHMPGVQAEYVAVPEESALPIPQNLSFEQAASFPLVFLTAWHMLVGIARIQFCEDVLIVGGSSGVGVAAIQIAKLFHCRVITTAGGEEKMAKAVALGADHVIDHYRQNIREEVRKLTAKRGVDIVFEHVGKATWNDSVACLAHHGRLVSCGATTGSDVGLHLGHLFFKQLSLHGSFMGTLGELHEVLKLFDRGLLRPVVDRVFPIAEVRVAHERLENREQFGKIVLAL
jgi:NADPH:quinone reductase-like Zn-dependent oxidoreductase